MVYQLSDIRTKVQQRVRDTAYSTTEITNYLNDTQNDVYNEYRLKFMRTSQAYTVTIGNSDITAGASLPTNHVQTIKLINTTDGQEAEVDFIDEDELDALYPDHADTTRHPNGQPQYAYDDGDTVRLFPAPAAAYTLKLRYYKKPTALSADADVPEVPSEFEELLVEGASYRVLQVKDNYDQAGIHENKYQEQLQKLVMKYSQTQSGRVVQMPINRLRSIAPSSTRWR